MIFVVSHAGKKVVAQASRQLRKNKLNYPMYNLELAAIVYDVTYRDTILFDIRVIFIRTIEFEVHFYLAT